MAGDSSHSLRPKALNPNPALDNSGAQGGESSDSLNSEAMKPNPALEKSLITGPWMLRVLSFEFTNRF